MRAGIIWVIMLAPAPVYREPPEVDLTGNWEVTWKNYRGVVLVEKQGVWSGIWSWVVWRGTWKMEGRVLLVSESTARGEAFLWVADLEERRLHGKLRCGGEFSMKRQK